MSVSIGLSHRERTSYISETVAPTTAILKPLFDDFELSTIELKEVQTKATRRAQIGYGLSELYYAGVYSWLHIRDKVLPGSYEKFFQGAGRVALENFTFRTSPHTFIEGQLQSALSAPTILAAWTKIADRSNRHDPKMDDFGQASRSDIIAMLRTDWFPGLLRTAGVTNSGFYRNTTGYQIRYTSFVQRSVIKPLREYSNDCPGGQFPVITSERGGQIIDATLSGDFEAFLAQRMRKHNRSINQDEPLHDGTSNGCPFARNTHIVTEWSTPLPVGSGRYEEIPGRPNKAKLHLAWDPYRQVSHLLAATLERLD